MQNSLKKVSIIVPTLNPGDLWQDWCERVNSQTLCCMEVIQIDSESDHILNAGLLSDRLLHHSIPRIAFNHGGTRNLGASLANENVEFLIFMTQDALLADSSSLEQLLKPFEDDEVAVVCGRQLPHIDANAIAAHARYFNYPEESSVKILQDKCTLGIKTAFMSNSFAAYRKSVFDKIGGFPSNTILAEDMYLTAKMLLAGYKVAYSADAMVKHSHNYSVSEEFKRYFDIGVFHTMEPWIIETFGKAEGEGKKFVLSEIRYLIRHDFLSLPRAIIQTCAKYLGYKIGAHYKHLPISFCKRMSMTKSFWKEVR